MSKRDKIIFKELARTANGKTPTDENEILYVRFFNALEASKAFDKGKIKAKLAGTTLLNDFSESCGYLYHTVLRAIQVSSTDSLAEVSDLQLQIKALINKGLGHHIRALYDQAMSVAEETENFADKLKLMKLLKVSLINLHGDNRTLGVFQKLAQHEQAVWEKEANLHAWESLFDTWVSLRVANDKGRALIEGSILNHPLYINDGPCLSARSKIVRMLIKDRPLTDVSPNQEERIANLIAIANFVEQHFGLFEDSLVVNRYLNIVSTIGVLASNFQKPQAIELARQKLEQFAQARKEAEVLVFERIEELNILHVRDWSDFSAADEVIERILKGLVYYGERVNRRRRIFFMLAICEIYLLTNRPAATAKLLATLVHDSPLESGPRANILLWSYYLIAEYELGHQDIMKQWAKTAARYVKEFAIDDQPGIALIHFLRELSRKSDPGKRKTVFRRFASEVAPMLEVPPNQFYENRFPFTKWVQCQLTEVAFPPK